MGCNAGRELSTFDTKCHASHLTALFNLHTSLEGSKQCPQRPKERTGTQDMKEVAQSIQVQSWDSNPGALALAPTVVLSLTYQTES